MSAIYLMHIWFPTFGNVSIAAPTQSANVIGAVGGSFMTMTVARLANG